jgi:hypothetical protein
MIRLFNEAPLDKSGTEIIMTLAEQWKQEGERIGIEKGIERGLERGEKVGKLDLVKNYCSLSLATVRDPILIYLKGFP